MTCPDAWCESCEESVGTERSSGEVLCDTCWPMILWEWHYHYDRGLRADPPPEPRPTYRSG